MEPSEPEIPEIPKLNREILGDAFAEVAARLPDGAEDHAMKALLEIVAPFWREDVLPNLLTGWNLLQRSMLSPQERSTIIAAASMSVSNVDLSQTSAKRKASTTETPSRLTASCMSSKH